MIEYRAEDTVSFFEILSKYKSDTRWKFRGHSSVKWELVPTARREPFSDYSDYKIFSQWKRKAFQLLGPDYSSFNDWDLLAIAQHHGVPTRLLDWAHNPLIAAFFAVQEKMDEDAIVYALRVRKWINQEKIKSPFDVNDSIKYLAPNISSFRMAHQMGHFTVHSENKPVLSEETIDDNWEIEKIVISQDYRDELIHDLHFFGINNLTVYPDMEGLSKHIRWWVQNREFWTKGPDANV